MPMQFTSSPQVFPHVELNYIVIANEFIMIVYVINKFYISRYLVFVHTDNFFIHYLMNKPITNGRVTRLLLLLQEFDITIIDNLERENAIVEFFYRLTNDGDSIHVKYSSPNEHLFALSINTLWFAEISNYLLARKISAHLSLKERQKIIK